MSGEQNTQGRRKRTRRLKLAPRSGVWSHFTRLRDDDGNETGQAECNHCHGQLSAKHGTTSLRKHVKVCSGQEAACVGKAAALPQQPPPPRAPSPPGGPSGRDPAGLEEASKHLARMIALRGHDPSFVEDDYFRSFVRSLNPGFVVPSREAVEEMCDGIFDQARRDLLDRLKCAPGKVNLAVGRAKTMGEQVLYVACHFIDDEWNLQKLVLHVLVTGDRDECDGPILGFNVSGDYEDISQDVVDVILDHGIYGERLFMLACETTDEDLHLVLKDCLEPVLMFDTNPSSREIYVDNVLHSIARCLLPHPDVTPHIILEYMTSIYWTRQEHLHLLSELDLDYEWACDQHWCACYFSLEVLPKKGFTDLVDAGKTIAPLVVRLLRKIWEQVYRGIQRISTSTFPTSNLCLAELLKLREFLQAELARFSGEDAHIEGRYNYYDDGEPKDVFRVASNTLDKAIQDSYLVWSVPLALDPRYKLRYIEFSFQRAFGSEEAGKYVLEVTAKINKLYADYIKVYGTIATEDQPDASNGMMHMNTTSADQWEQAWNNHRCSQGIMAAQVNSCYTEIQTELDRYLQDPLALGTKDFDILNWWKVHSSEYPMVARMARDALAMPTCSKLSSDQLAQVRSILRRYSKKPFGER
ncbi:unnamed protein product [Urochloa decumbens]|uniref:BED-type domain-containing protein n=1 Tax=Urochloa decumbens TaxID=240449 RepID=A0ABC9BV89_9POAL